MTTMSTDFAFSGPGAGAMLLTWRYIWTMSPIVMMKRSGLRGIWPLNAASSVGDSRVCPIPSGAVVPLLENVAAQSGCDVVGLRMSESRGIAQFGVVSLLLSQQPTSATRCRWP